MVKRVKFNDFRNFDFQKEDSEDNPNHFKINGVAINSGIYHGDFIEIPDIELENCKKTLKGSKVFQNHDYDLDDIIGKVDDTEVKFNNESEKYAVFYDGYIDKMYDKIIYKIETGLIEAVSIGFSFTPMCSICGEYIYDCGHFWEDDFHVVARDIEIFDLSIVSLPADENATVSVTSFSEANFKKQFQEQFKDKIKNKKDKFFDKLKNNDRDIEKNKSDNMVNDKEIARLNKELEALKAENAELKAKDENEAKINEIKQELQEKFNEELGAKEETIAQLTSEKKELDTELIEVKTELKVFKDKFEKIDNERLESKKEILIELHRECTGEETIDVEKLDEETVDGMIETYEKVKEKYGKKEPKKFTKDKYKLPYGSEKIKKFADEGKHVEAVAEGVKETFKRLRGIK